MKIIFAKYNSERLPKYQIVTKIVEDNNKKRYAIKEPLCEEAQEHISTIYKNYELLKSNYDINLVKPTIVENGLLFEMAEGSSLENILLHAINNNDEEKFQKYINNFLNLLDSMVYKRDVMFEPSKEFEEVFGRWNIDKPQDIIKVANIDMIFGNIFVNEKDEFTFIDYEWVYDFEIPKSFVVWRSLYVFAIYHSVDMNKFCKIDNEFFINMDYNFGHIIHGKRKEYYLASGVRKNVDFISLEEKDKAIQEKDKAIQEKDKAIQEKDKAIQEKDKAIQEKDKAIQEKDIHIQNLHIIVESLRLKNRAKRLIKKAVPEKIWKIARYIKHNPSSIKLGLHTIKSQGIGALYRKIKKVNHLSESRIVNDYTYREPDFTEAIKQKIKQFNYKPLISIIMPVYNVDPKWLELAIKSIENQWYENWELCIADDKSTNKKTTNYLKSLNNAKIKIKYLDKNLNISGSSNAALELAEGEYLLLMDNDDEITPDALYEVVKVINETNADFIYSDEDKMEMNGTFCEPHFKPDFAPDMFLSQNYISHLGVIKKELIDKVNGFTIGLEGAQDYDLYLKVLEHTDKIYHIPKVLYHWRKIPGSTAAEFGEKSYAQEAGRKSIENAMKRRNIDVIVENGKYPGTYKVNYILKELPLVSIIIPFKDKPELLDMCINSVLDKSTYKNYEIIGISNNSIEESTFIEMKKLEAKSEKVKFYEYNVPFNYSMINNHAVNTYAKGEHIILLNNDIEIITCEWIEEMLMFSQREDIGCVGAKLYYPNDTIQHAGVVIGIGGIAGHSHKYFHKNNPGYISRLNLIQNFSAVTAACLMVKKSIYNQVEGLNEKDLKIAFNDVDFCLRVQEKSYKNIFTPYCEAYHHESISRGAEDNLEKITRFNSEVDFMKLRHKDILKNGDPYYNVNLTLDREDFGL